jgi:heme exporter protein D|tara:strand:+ start:156 stop:374 length:219 start_codon:yes stop_codon:yes gene_type:complete
MESNIFILGGYGQFVWPAFIFTFSICLTLYLRTSKQLQKQEKIYFAEHKELHIEKIKTFKEPKGIQEAFSTN